MYFPSATWAIFLQYANYGYTTHTLIGWWWFRVNCSMCHHLSEFLTPNKFNNSNYVCVHVCVRVCVRYYVKNVKSQLLYHWTITNCSWLKNNNKNKLKNTTQQNCKTYSIACWKKMNTYTENSAEGKVLIRKNQKKVVYT